MTNLQRRSTIGVVLGALACAPGASAAPGWNVSGPWRSPVGDLALTQAAKGSIGGTFRMKHGCTATYRVSGKIDGAKLALSLALAGAGSSGARCAGTQTLKGSVSSGGNKLTLVLANFAQTSPPTTFTGHGKRDAVRAVGSAAVVPTTRSDATDAVYNLIENNRPSCPIVRWKFYKVTQGTFRGISHPGRGKLLWKVTVEVEWAGVSMFWHTPSWTVVGKQVLPADMDSQPSRVYRDREAAWIIGACLGPQPFGQQ